MIARIGPPPILRSIALFAALVIPACSAGSEQEQERAELADLADGLRAAIDDHIKSCADMGAALAKWHAAHFKRFQELRAAHPTLSGEQRARWDSMLGAMNRTSMCLGNPMLGRDDPEVKRVVTALKL